MNKENRKKHIIWFAVLNAILVLLALFIIFVQKNRASLMYHEQAAERFQGGDTKYSQVSAYFASGGEDNKRTLADVKNFENTIMKSLYDDGYVEQGEANKSWYDSYAACSQTEIRKDENTVTANVFGVGGDFFSIHQMPLLSGSYFSSENDDLHQIILDENIAWTLFGSTKVGGLKVWIGEAIFTITGVVAVEEDKASEQAYGNFNSVYIPYKALMKLDENAGLIAYEAVIPAPIKRYGYNLLAEAVGVEELSDSEKENLRSSLDFGDVMLVENSERFGLISLYKVMKNNKYQSMKTNGIVLPFWENVARFEEQHEIKWYRLAFILLLLPFVSLVVTVVKLIKMIPLKKGVLWLVEKIGDIPWMIKKRIMGSKVSK